MDYLTPVTSLDEVDPVPIPDVRAVPLDKLAFSDSCDELVARVVSSYSCEPRVPVAMFDSAI
jgi:hypothetical protein